MSSSEVHAYRILSGFRFPYVVSFSLLLPRFLFNFYDNRGRSPHHFSYQIILEEFNFATRLTTHLSTRHEATRTFLRQQLYDRLRLFI